MNNPWKKFKEWDERRWQMSGVKKWERTRAKGKMRYALENAVFLALFVTVFNALWSWVETNGWSIHGAMPQNFYRDLFIKPVAWFIAGYISGVISWNRVEKDYLKYKEKHYSEIQDI
jgi:hypothetical protein